MAPKTQKKRVYNVPKREEEIGQRVRKMRQDLNFTQSKFAEIIGISRGRLDNCECGRAPLIFSVGWEICRRFKTNPRWLVTGKGPGKADFLFTSHYKKIEKVALPKMLFSEAYKKHVEPMLNKLFPKNVLQFEMEDVMEDLTPEKFKAVEKLRNDIYKRAFFIKSDHFMDYVEKVRNFSDKLSRKFLKEGKTHPMTEIERF